MKRQRWGTFSVIDHKDPVGLGTEVLMYDRLVIPVPLTQEDRDHWKKDWNLDLLDDRLKILGDLAVRARWGYADSQSALHQWAAQFADIKEDTEDILKEAKQSLGYQLTRRVLAQQKYPLPMGVEEVDLVEAYQSKHDLRTLRTDFIVQKAPNDRARANLGLMLRQKIAVPLVENDSERALEKAVRLARDPKFLIKRATVYELQNQFLSLDAPALETLQEMERRTEELIDYVKLMTMNVRFTNAFTLTGLRPGYALGRSYPPPPFASKSTTLSVVAFKARSTAFTPVLGSSAPTVMYHD